MVEEQGIKTTLKKPISPNNPNQTENQWGAPVIYTEEFVLNELKELLKALKKDKEIVYLWELFLEKDYTRQRYGEWVKTYSKVKDMEDHWCDCPLLSKRELYQFKYDLHMAFIRTWNKLCEVKTSSQYFRKITWEDILHEIKIQDYIRGSYYLVSKV